MFKVLSAVIIGLLQCKMCHLSFPCKWTPFYPPYIYVDQFPWRTTGQEIILTIGTFLGVRHDFFFFLVIYRLKWQYTNVCLMRVTSHWQKCFIYITASIHSALIGSRPQLDNYLHGPQRSVVCIEIIPSPTPKMGDCCTPLEQSKPNSF